MTAVIRFVRIERTTSRDINTNSKNDVETLVYAIENAGALPNLVAAVSGELRIACLPGVVNVDPPPYPVYSFALPPMAIDGVRAPREQGGEFRKAGDARVHASTKRAAKEKAAGDAAAKKQVEADTARAALGEQAQALGQEE